MPRTAAIFVTLTALGSLLMLARQVRTQMRRSRNLKHWERHEPLERTDDDWD
jgi:hypothetical protein